MCAECGDDFFEDNDDDNFLNQIPEYEREEFFSYACEQFKYMIDQADTRNMLYPLITEWNRDRQAAYTMACVMEKRAQQMKKDIEED